ncbi:cytochrome P450 [Thozetella sp. PMI_491]|nr:cytochrome P450 [Thozetella sp. PMI_491]
MLLEPWMITAYLGLAFLAYSFLKIVVDGLTNPRRHLPGPWYGRYTAVVYEFYRVLGLVSWYSRSQQTKYGPIVLLTPNRVAIGDDEAWAHICRMGTDFVKGPFYERFRIGPERVMFNMTDQKEHAARRKLFARAFSLESLRKTWEAPIRDMAELTVHKIKGDAETGTADVYKWWRLMAGDVIARLCFGETFDMVKGGKKTPFFRALVNAGLLVILRDILVFPVNWLHYILPLESVRELLRADQVIYDQGTVAVEYMRKANSDEANFFRNVVAEADTDEKAKLSDDAVRSEAAVFMIAGSDTTAFSLSYITWAVLRRPELQRKIEQEVAGLPEDFSDKDVEKLHVLNNAIDETMRLYNAAAGPLPRVVPKGGVTFCGHYLPEGSIAVANHLTLARLPKLFENPDMFDETRWDNMTSEQKRMAQPFGLGSRNCVGQHLAKIETRLALALFFRELKGAKVAKSTTDDMMEDVRIQFIGKPRGGRCDITLLESEA